MSELKHSLRLALIDNQDARRLLIARHPLGVGLAFSFALGVFWEQKLEGVLTWGRPGVNTAVHAYALRASDALELRKMWNSDEIPSNGESRILGIATRMIRKQYPALKLLLTYCGSDESATAYRAAGWIPQTAHSYLREVCVQGKGMSLREINRRGGAKIIPVEAERYYVSRRKWVYPLDKDTERTVRNLMTATAEIAPVPKVESR